MSDFGRSGDTTPTSGDRWRYAWLFVLGSLVLLVLLSRVEGAVVILLAICLVALSVAGVVVLVRQRRRT